MDYVRRRRLKLLGHVRVQDVSLVSSEILEMLALPDYQATCERVFFIDVHAFAWNCPAHITPWFSREEFVEMNTLDETGAR